LYKIIWIQGLIDFAISAYFIFVSWQLYHDTENALYAGLLVGLGFLPSFLSNLYFGVLVDQYNKKLLLFIALIIMAMTLLIVFLMVNKFVPLLYIFTHMIVQLCSSLIRPAMQAYVASIFSKEQFLFIFTKSTTFTISGGIVGAFIGSLLVTKSLILVLSLIILVPIMISIWLLSTLPTVKPLEHRQTQTVIKEVISGFQYCFTNSYFLQLLILMAIGQVIYHTTLGFLAAYVYDILQSTAIVYGALNLFFSTGGILVGIFSVRITKYLKNWFPIVATGMLTLCLFSLAIQASLPLVAISCIGIGYCTTWIRTNLQAIQQSSTKEQFHGRTASIRMFLNQGSVVCLSPIVGYFAQQQGIHIVFIILTCISIVGIAISIKLMKNIQFILTVHKFKN